MRNAWSFLLVGVIVACAKKEPPEVRTACVLADEQGTVVQCFEQNDLVPRERRESNCQAFEAAKKTLIDGECPASGRLGVCAIGEHQRRACYSNPEGCEASCKSSGGTFTR
ncbi:MAG: hypothetical protein OZ921_03585 [Sorangiineae bacterium]|nr:hypothetical protein [Polyangiaceae bacterium]MEB2321571.1 hypothetical protein [Sorangiineae bacterium]